ncbi:MAG: hypothetical protein PVG66_05200 [Chromatiales bacterium]
MSFTNNFRTTLHWHADTARQTFNVMPLWILLSPFVFMLLLYGLEQTWLSPYLTKDAAEIVAPTILSVALLLALWPLLQQPHSYYKWQALLGLALLLREWHFVGTNTGFYVAFVLLIWWASRYRDRLQPFLRQRWIVGLFAASIWCYLVSKSFDRHYWDTLIPAGVSSDLFEENLEVIGHLLYLALVATSIRLRKNLPLN